MDQRKRRLFIGGAGIAALAAAWLAPSGREAGLVLPLERTQDSASPESRRLAALPARAALGEARGDPFGTQTPPAAHRPASAKDEPPPAPVAPPNPYKVAGTVVQGGTKRVYLVNGDRVYEARQGDDLGDGYRVEAIAADHVVLLYVPLGKKEELPITATLGTDVPAAPAPAAITNAPAPEPQREEPEKARAGTRLTFRRDPR